MIHRLVFCLLIALAAVGLATGLTPTAVAQQQAAVPVDDLIRVLTNRDAFSEECVSVSRALAARTAEAIPALVQQLPTAGELAQLRILAALSRMGPAAAPALPEVRRLLQAGTPFVRAASADCLRALGDAGREALPDLFKALGDPDPVTVGTAARAIDALDPAFVATRLKDLLDRLGSSPASVDRLTLGTWYCIACRQADDTDLARDLRHWMLVVCYTGRDELRVGDAQGPGARKSQTESRTVSAAEVRATVLQRLEFGRLHADGCMGPVHWREWGETHEGDATMTVERSLAGRPKRPSAEVGIQIPDAIITDCERLCCSPCLLENDPSIISPDVLSKERDKFDQTGDDKSVEKAHRRGKFGWDVGKHVEVIPHDRRPHLRLAWTGAGRAVPTIVPRRGTIVHRSKVEAVPSGFGEV